MMVRARLDMSAFVRKRGFILSSLLIVTVGGVLRFHDLSGRSLWFDEAAAANYSRGTLSETIANTRNRNSSPILYPLILHGLQRIDGSAFAVRLPAAMAGTLAVVVLLSLVRVGLARKVVVIAALMLAVSAMQIRYSQEVREYALAVLLATLMLYGLLSSLCGNERRSGLLCISMLIAPLVQYGLVLFGVAILGVLTLVGLRDRGLKATMRGVAKPAVMLAVGSALSYFLTLRYQLGRDIEAGWWYLEESFYGGRVYDIPDVLAFVAVATNGLLMAMVEGELLIGLALPAIGVMAYRCMRAAKGEYCHSWTILTLMVVSIAIVASAAILRVYPYGGIRQCLFLAPVIGVGVALAYEAVAAGMSRREGKLWFVLVLSLVLVAGAKDARRRNPYAEQEDVKSIISTVERSANDEDIVYVYYGAKPALDFYRVGRQNFVYGSSHRREPEGYIREFYGLVGLDVDRVWIVFSHVVSGEESFMIENLMSQWDFEKKVDVRGASLYLGVRRRSQEISDQHQMRGW